MVYRVLFKIPLKARRDLLLRLPTHLDARLFPPPGKLQSKLSGEFFLLITVVEVIVFLAKGIPNRFTQIFPPCVPTSVCARHAFPKSLIFLPPPWPVAFFSGVAWFSVISQVQPAAILFFFEWVLFFYVAVVGFQSQQSPVRLLI